jgi:hypothetical protein
LEGSKAQFLGHGSKRNLEGSVRGQQKRDDKDTLAAARFRGWNRDLKVRANPLGFVVVSGVRDVVTTVNYDRSNNIPIAVRGKGAALRDGQGQHQKKIDSLPKRERTAGARVLGSDSRSYRDRRRHQWMRCRP